MTGVPEGAVLEDVLAGGVGLWDVTRLLGQHKRKRYPERDVADICRVYHHHSGALGRAGFAGALGTSRYVTRARQWPGFPYTYFLAYEPDRDEHNRLVVYRGQSDSTRSYHTGRAANGHGVAVCWQGNLRTRRPSDAQVEMAEALCAWLAERHELSDDRPQSFHSEASDFGGKAKPACPGPHVEQWVRRWRGEESPGGPS